MRLRELEAWFSKFEPTAPTAEERALNPQWPPDHLMECYARVETLAEADGIWFLCPKCFAANGGPVGTHSVSVGFTGRCPPGSYGQNLEGQDVRWQVAAGTSLDDLSLTPSIQLLSENPTPAFCAWHGFVGSSGVPPGCAA